MVASAEACLPVEVPTRVRPDQDLVSVDRVLGREDSGITIFMTFIIMDFTMMMTFSFLAGFLIRFSGAIPTGATIQHIIPMGTIPTAHIPTAAILMGMD